MKKGFTLIETVVAMGVFSLLTVTTSLLLFGTLRGSKKAAAALAVRTEGANVINSITQELRYAKEITSPTPGPSSMPTTSITYKTLNQGDVILLCDNANKKIILGGSNLTSSKFNVSDCGFVYIPSSKTVSVDFKLSTTGTGSTILDEVQNVQFKTQVVLRN